MSKKLEIILGGLFIKNYTDNYTFIDFYADCKSNIKNVSLFDCIDIWQYFIKLQQSI
jgi:hypothetical protein